MRAATVAVLWVWCAAVAHAADPTPPISGPGTFKHVARIKVDTAAVLIPTETPPKDKVTVLADRDGEWTVAGDPGTYRFAGTAIYIDIDWDKKKSSVRSVPYSFDFLIQGGPPTPPAPPGPVPPGPTPPGPTPPPGPVQSFRVALIYESNDTITAAQNSVIYGKVVEEFLTAKTTKDGTSNGWRRRDKDAPADGDTATWNALWGAVKPKVTATPCVAVEVNGKVTIEPLPASPDAAIALFKTYLGEK